MPTETTPIESIRQMLRNLFRGDTLRATLRDWKWILTFTRSHWVGVLVLTCLGLTSSSLGLLSGIITKNLIDSIITLNTGKLIPMTALMVASAALGVVFQSFSARYSAHLNTTMHQEVQRHTFERLIHSDWMSLRRFPTGDLLNRFSGDISTISGCAITFLPSVIVQFFTLVVTFGLICYYDPTMALICLISTPVLFLASRSLLRRQREYNVRLRKVSSGMTGFQSETFRNIDTLKGFGIEGAVTNQLLHWQK